MTKRRDLPCRYPNPRESRHVVRVLLKALSLIFGGVGVFFLWQTFYTPHYGLLALLCLFGATAIVFAPSKVD